MFGKAGVLSYGAAAAEEEEEAAAAAAGSARRQLDTVMAYHGQASGVFSAGECLCGRKPDAGTETCAVVETMESLGQLFTVTGEIAYLDQLERVAFNALPAAFFNGSMGAMQYFQHAVRVTFLEPCHLLSICLL